MDRMTNSRVDMTVLRDRVRGRREALRLDQEAVAERAGLSAAYISRLERGAVPNPKVFDLERVASALHTSVGSLLRPSDTDPDDARVDECAELMAQLDGEPQEVVDTVMSWWRDSIRLAKMRRQG